jgi:hypothetical protein
MSTVLWANVLVNGTVQSEQEDRVALYKHGDRLDGLCKSLGLPSFLAVCDTTDLRFNVEDLELPPGLSSTDQMMARDGAWMDLGEATDMLEKLLAHIRSKKVRFGLLSNQHDDVVVELTEVIAFAKTHVGTAQKFNFSVVM